MIENGVTKTIQQIFYSKKNLLIFFSIFPGQVPKTKNVNVIGLSEKDLLKQLNSYFVKCSRIIFHILNQLPLLFLRKIFIMLTMELTLFFLFFLRKILICFSGLVLPFFLFLLQKDSNIFQLLLYGDFLYLSDNFYCHFYIKYIYI